MMVLLIFQPTCYSCQTIISTEAAKNKKGSLGVLGIAIWVNLRVFQGRERVRGLSKLKPQIVRVGWQEL